MKSAKISKIYQNRLFQHLLFWCISFYLLLRLFQSSEKIEKIDYIYTALFHISLILGTYANLLFLIPRFLSKKRNLVYGILLIGLIIGIAKFNILFFDKWVGFVLPDYYFISYYDFFDIVKFVIAYIGITSLIKLSKGWFELTEAKNKLNELQKKKVEFELKALKGQINPHFLFNSMNSIYSLALNSSPKTPEIILKLSDIMRYIIYEANLDFVDLTKEINYLKDYIDIQKLRTDDKSTVKFDITGKLEKIRIAPLLLFPLVENSFKHGIKGETGKSFVNIHLLIDENSLVFTVVNNKGVTVNIEKAEYKGIGLENIRKRLEMIYPGQHKLFINDTKETFKVELTINHLGYENKMLNC